jgi:hypothetical protein
LREVHVTDRQAGRQLLGLLMIQQADALRTCSMSQGDRMPSSKHSPARRQPLMCTRVGQVVGLQLNPHSLPVWLTNLVVLLLLQGVFPPTTYPSLGLPSGWYRE